MPTRRMKGTGSAQLVRVAATAMPIEGSRPGRRTRTRQPLLEVRAFGSPTRSAVRPHGREAAPRFELGIRELQSHALPLCYAANYADNATLGRRAAGEPTRPWLQRPNRRPSQRPRKCTRLGPGVKTRDSDSAGCQPGPFGTGSAKKRSHSQHQAAALELVGRGCYVGAAATVGPCASDHSATGIWRGEGRRVSGRDHGPTVRASIVAPTSRSRTGRSALALRLACIAGRWLASVSNSADQPFGWMRVAMTLALGAINVLVAQKDRAFAS